MGKRDSVKTLKIASIVTFLALVFVSMGIVSALNASEASVTSFWSIAEPSPGQLVTVNVTFQSSSSQALYIYRMGLHADWMASGSFATLDFQDDPEVVEAGGIYVAKFPIQIPATASIGTHSYSIAADGFDQSGASFQWDSSAFSITISPQQSASTSPTATPDDTQANGGLSSVILYAAIILVVAIVAILVAIIVMKKRGRKLPAARPLPAAPQPNQPESSPPEQKPEEKDFTI